MKKNFDLLTRRQTVVALGSASQWLSQLFFKFIKNTAGDTVALAKDFVINIFVEKPGKKL